MTKTSNTTVKSAQIQKGIYSLASVPFKNVYLRMDGQEVKSFKDEGSGIVNCQFGSHPWEKFIIHPVGRDVYAFESAAFKNVFLRLDGRDINKNTSEKNGGGVVNCQWGMGPWEEFRIEDHGSFMVIRSVAFPDACLRLDGTGVKEFLPAGGGIVNAQYNYGLYERFTLVPAK